MKKLHILSLSLCTALVAGLIFISNGHVFKVTRETMEPTYTNGSLVWVNPPKEIHRGDNVIIKNTENRTFIVKRIIGLPGENLQIANGKILINNKILHEEYYSGNTSSDMVRTLKDDEYFVLGDNRDISYDSRAFGPVKKNKLLEW